MRRRMVGLCPVLSRSLLAAALVAACGGDDESGEVPDAGGAGATADASVALFVEVGSTDVVAAVGEALPLYVAVVRREWVGEVVVTASGLPAGASAEPVTLTGEEGETLLQIAVDAAAMPGGPYPIEVTASGGGATVSEPVQLQIRRRGGRLDGAFSGDGVFYDPFLGASNVVHGLEVLRSGLILLGLDRPASTPRFAIARMTPEGEVDDSFGDGGVASIDSGGPADGWTWTVQPDAGRVLVMRRGVSPDPAYLALEVSALTPAGQPDEVFGVRTSLLARPDGADVSLCCAAALADGSAYVAGTVEGFSGRGVVLLHVREDGEIDREFGVDGIARGFNLGDARGLAVQPDGHILVAGGNRTVRFTPYGGLDGRFGRDGQQVLLDAQIEDVAWTSGGIVLAGKFSENTPDDNVVRRLTHAGEIDSSFAKERPLLIYGHGRRVRQDEEGSLLVAGWGFNSDFSSFGLLVRFLPDGTLDPFFSDDGFVVAPPDPGGEPVAPDFTEMTITPAGRVLVAGTLLAERDRAIVVAYTP